MKKDDILQMSVIFAIARNFEDEKRAARGDGKDGEHAIFLHLYNGNLFHDN